MHAPLGALRLLPLLVLLLGPTGCATRTGPFGARRAPEAQGARLMVQNPHWEALTIYLDREGTLFRLGVVEGNQDRTLDVPPVYLTANCWVRLIAMTGGREQHAASEVFGFGPGDYGTWKVGLVGRSSPVHVGEAPDRR